MAGSKEGLGVQQINRVGGRVGGGFKGERLWVDKRESGDQGNVLFSGAKGYVAIYICL